MKKILWKRHSHILKDDDYECPVCGCIAEQPYSVCPGCGNSMSGPEEDSSWIDELEELDMILDD